MEWQEILDLYQLFKARMAAQKYVHVQGNVPYGDKIILTKLRSGSLPLHVEVDCCCKPKVDLENRMCKLCDMNIVEDEIHFLTECPLYAHLQYKMLQSLSVWGIDCNKYVLLVKTWQMIYISGQFLLGKQYSYCFKGHKMCYGWQ